MERGLEYYLSLNYDIKIQEISEDDGGGWLARIDELEGCIADGETPSEAVENINVAKKDWIKFCLKKGLDIPEPKQYSVDSYSGRFTLRISKSIHAKLTHEAKSEGVSVNCLINNYIVMGLQNTTVTNSLRDLLNEVYKPNINILISPKSKTLPGARQYQTDKWDMWEGRGLTTELFHL